MCCMFARHQCEASTWRHDAHFAIVVRGWIAAAAVADSDAPEVGAAGTASAMPVLVFVLAAVAVTSVVDRMSADRMADCTQKLQATISAAVESWQTRFNSFAYCSARSIFYWADGCSTRCDLFNLVPRCPVSQCQSPQFDGVAMSGLAFSVAPSVYLYLYMYKRDELPVSWLSCLCINILPRLANYTAHYLWTVAT